MPADTGGQSEPPVSADDAATGTDSEPPPDDTSVDDSAAEDAGATADVQSAPPPDVGVGAGCASGAKVIMLFLPDSGYSANTMNFGTAGPACVELYGSVHQGWGLSNEQGRMVTLISAAGAQGPIDASAYASLPAAPQAGTDGFVYWNFTAGTVDYTSLYIF